MTTKIQYENIQQATLNVIDSPKITAITYPGDDTAADTAGGQTITITGSNFLAGASVIINGSAVGVVSVVSANSITFTSPAQSSGSYPLYIVNTNGGTAVAVPGIQYSGTPTWTTAAGSLGSYTETQVIANTVTATGDAPITYSLYSGTLPTGATLNTSNGYISGTSPLENSPTTFTFTIRATDAQAQDTDRQFSLTINPDVVTWSSPANGTTYTSQANSAISNVTMSASAASGQSITYTANALPTGLSISGSNITGTPTVVANSSSLLTATAATTLKTATRTINWVITVANDPYFPYVSLLLSANTPSSTFVADASTNNFAITVNGDTRPNNLNPYTPGYYSNYFDGTGDYLNTTGANLVAGTGAFTAECWIYATADNTYDGYISTAGSTPVDTGFVMALDQAWIGSTSIAVGYAWKSSIKLNTWNHLALTRDGGGLVRWFVNGVLLNTSSQNVTNMGSSSIAVGRRYYNEANYYATGYISNVRYVVGSALYTTSFTPSTTPLTAVSGTQLLTCQSNRFIDNSTNNFTITKNGDTTVSGFIPYTPNSSYSTYGSGYFDGTGDYLSISGNTAFDLSTSSFTIDGWFYPTANNGMIINYGVVPGSSQSSYNYQVYYVSTVLNFRYSTGSFSTASSSNNIIFNAWNYFCITRVTSTLTIYLNGTTTTTSIPTTINNNVNSTIRIGIDIDSSYPLNGYISDLRVIKGTAISSISIPAAPLTAIANTSLLTLQNNQTITNNTFIDNSTNNYLITRNGNPTSGTFSPYAGSYSNYFDSNKYMYAASNAAFALGTGDFTIEAWVYPTSAYTTYNYILGVGSTGGLVFYVTGGNLVVRAYNVADQLSSSTIPALNTWTHVAATRSGTTLRIFVNGVQTASTTNSYNFAQGVAYIGNDGTNAAPWYGYISNLHLVKGTAVYTSAFTPPTAPLTPIANTCLLTCQSNRFIDNSINNFTFTLSGVVTIQKFSPFDMQTATVPTSYSGYFDGSGDYLSVASNAAFNVGSGAYTVECWLYQYARNATAGGFFTLRNADDTSFPDLCVTSTGALQGFMSGGAQGSASTGTVPLNTWTHVAWVRNSGTVYYYINGVASGSTSQSTTWSGTTPKVGGQGWASAYCFNGLISNLRFVNGIAVYTGAFTVPTSPLAATQSSGTNISALTGTQTTLLTCQNSTIIDNSTNVWTVSAVSSPKVNINNPFGYTNPSAAAYTVSSLGGSMYFDGSGDYLTLSSEAGNISTTFTVEGWVYLTVAGSQCFISNYQNATNGWILGTDTNTYLAAWLTGDAADITGTTVVPINAWNHFALSGTTSSYKLFLNGVQTGSTFTGAVATTSTSSLTIGRLASLGITPLFGYLSDVRVIRGQNLYTSNFVPPTSPLTAIKNTTVLVNGTSAGIYDSSMNNDFETVGDTKISTSTVKFTGKTSMYFDGTGDYLINNVNSNNFTLSGDFTIEMWINPQAAVTNTYYTLIDTRPTGSSTTGYALWLLNSRLGMSFNNSDIISPVTGTQIATSSWTHIAYVRSGSTITTYINGVSQNTASTSASSTASSLCIGYKTYTSSTITYYNGYISDLRFTNGIARYTSNFTAPTSPFVQY